jgi:hypothetical protein
MIQPREILFSMLDEELNLTRHEIGVLSTGSQSGLRRKAKQ